MPRGTTTKKRESGGKPIVEVAKILGRSYSWVYARIEGLSGSDHYVDGRVICLKKSAIDKLAVISVRSPKRGRPRKHA